MQKAFFLSAIISGLTLLAHSPAYAGQIHTIDLSAYDIGDIPEELGSVVVKDGMKIKDTRIVAGYKKGSFTVKLPNPLKQQL